MVSHRRSPRRRALGASLAALFALAACSPYGDSPVAQGAEPPLAGAKIGADFALTAPDGRTVRWADFSGRPRIVYFGYTFCPDVCPVDLQKLMAGLAAFEKQDPARGASIQPLFITIDPQRDTPEAMGQYASAMHPRLLGLTGPEPAIAKVAKDFAVYRARAKDSGTTDYLMDHSRQAYLFDGEGQPLALLSVDRGPDGRPSTPSDIAAELDRWTPAA